MVERGRIGGLRIFLYGLLSLVKNGKQENCTWVEESLEKGIANVLYRKYQSFFDKLGFCTEYLDGLDVYYKNWCGISADKYACEEDDGLYFLIKLVLNEIQ